MIDFHTHTFPDKISEGVLAKLSKLSHTQYFTNGSVSGLLASMEEACVSYSVNLPVMTDAKQVEKVNGALIAEKDMLFSKGIITFGGMHPDYVAYKKELLRLKEHGILGIKVHPAYQNTDIDDIRMLRIIDAASELGLIVLTHAGIDIGIYDRNYTSVRQILNVINQVHPPKLVLAHMGNWACWDDVEQYLCGAPVWFDTAFAIGPITQDQAKSGTPYLQSNLSAEAFVRIVRKHGADKILFATDSPWESQKDYVGRVEAMPLDKTEKDLIFSGNAVKLLGLPLPSKTHTEHFVNEL
ncbi:MAG: amidohydrolase family protein [Eubacterium sp.]|nr:amidohydrolase family protein [Eubacterium sp.]NBI87075.1 metal-dependent hydrolase [Lachnospiraceae bacterium]